jgi:type 1 fimbriae regulatory protein FimE
MLKLVPQMPFCDESVRRAPGRKSNEEIGRMTKWITDHDVKRLRDAVKQNRHALRDDLMIVMAYRHGLRASELVGIKWDQVDLRESTLSVLRKKNGKPSVQSLEGDEIRALKKLEKTRTTSFVFESDRKGMPLRREAFNQLLAKASDDAGFEIKVNPHALRHACGYGLANAKQPTRNIQDFLGHKNIRHTETYTDLANGAFKGFGSILKG